MTWVKLDDGFYDHPKIVAAGPNAAWLHVCALGYCCRHLTDGVLPKAVVPQLCGALKGTAKLAARLVELGIWYDDGDTYQIHDYTEYQQSREKVLTKREKTATRVDAWRKRHLGNGEGNGVTPQAQDACVTPLLTLPPSRPDPLTDTGTYISTVLSQPNELKTNRRQA